MNQLKTHKALSSTNSYGLRIALAKPGGQIGSSYSGIRTRWTRANVQLLHAQARCWRMHNVGLGFGLGFARLRAPPKANLGLIEYFLLDSCEDFSFFTPHIERSLPVLNNGKHGPTR